METRVYLRLIEPEDFYITYKFRNDNDTIKLLGGNHYFVSREIERQWVLNKSNSNNLELYLSICLKENHEMIGYCSINNIDLRNCKAEWGGTIIDKAYWGNGYASEASMTMLDYLFRNYPIHRCYAYCLDEHKVTKRMFEKMGMSLEGLIRDDLYKDGVYKNKVLYSILREEFNQLMKDKELA